MVSWMKHLTLSGVTNLLASKQHTKDHIKHWLPTLFDLWEGGGEGSVCRRMQSKLWAWGMFAEPIIRYHHTWTKDTAEAGELLLLSLKELPFGEGESCKWAAARGAQGMGWAVWSSSLCPGGALGEGAEGSQAPQGVLWALQVEWRCLASASKARNTKQTWYLHRFWHWWCSRWAFQWEKANSASDPVTMLSWDSQPREVSSLSPSASSGSGSSWNTLWTFHPVQSPPSHCWLPRHAANESPGISSLCSFGAVLPRGDFPA